MYTLYPEIPLSENETFCFPNGQLTTYVEPDQTLEIAMSDLDPKIMSIFNKENCATAKEATAVRYHFSFVLIRFLFRSEFVYMTDFCAFKLFI